MDGAPQLLLDLIKHILLDKGDVVVQVLGLSKKVSPLHDVPLQAVHMESDAFFGSTSSNLFKHKVFLVRFSASIAINIGLACRTQLMDDFLQQVCKPERGLLLARKGCQDPWFLNAAHLSQLTHSFISKEF